MKAKTKKQDRTIHKPTTAQFGNYQGLYDFFNRELFGGTLPDCVLTFSRHSRAYGFFVPEIWGRGDDTACEIALNQDHLGDTKYSLSTLVHEMVHLWQHYHGSPPRRCYHDRQFAAKMEEVGLMTSDTGAEGGKRVGQKMTHYIIDGGAYDRAFQKCPKELLLPWGTIATVADDKEAKEKKKSKWPYVCPGCNMKAWGKAGLNLACGDCETALEMQEDE